MLSPEDDEEQGEGGENKKFEPCRQVKHWNKGTKNILSLKTFPQDMQMFIYILYLVVCQQ